MRLLTIIFLQLFLLYSSLYAQESSGFQFTGFIEVENKIYFKQVNPDYVDNGRNQVMFFLKSRVVPRERTNFLSAIEVRYDEVNPARNHFCLKEAYIYYKMDSFDLRIGKQIYAWGKADSINPTNNLNPIDYSDFLDTDGEEIGVVSIEGKYYLKRWTFEWIIIPTFETNIFPAYNSRWNIFPKLLISLPAQVKKPPNKIDNTQFAGRILSSFNGWDFSVSYYKGFDKFPSMFVNLDNNSNPSSVLLEYRKLQVIGGDFATSFDKVGIRGEAGYFITDDFNGRIPEVSDPYFLYVLGVDYNFNLIRNQNLYVLCQWIQNFSLPKQSGSTSLEGDLKRLFQKMVMVKGDWNFTDYTKFSLQEIWRPHENDMFLQTIFSSNLSDGLTFEIGMDLFYGKSGSFFESFNDNQRAFVKLKYSFQ
ncbi:MAG: DUF1302 family protein [bacterium]